MTEEKPIEVCPGGLHCASRQIFTKIVYEKEINDLKAKLKRAEEILEEKDGSLQRFQNWMNDRSINKADDEVVRISRTVMEIELKALAIKIGNGE